MRGITLTNYSWKIKDDQMSKTLAETAGRKSRTCDDTVLSKRICKLAQETQQILLRALKEYTPLVEAILHSECCDSRHIEHTLDGLLDFCFDANALMLYKKLCRYYYFIDPRATVSYINAYRKMWDEDNDKIYR